MKTPELTPEQKLYIGAALVLSGAGALLVGFKVGGIAVFAGGFLIATALDSLPERF